MNEGDIRRCMGIDENDAHYIADARRQTLI